MGYAREPVFLLSHSHPDRPRPARRHHRTLRLRPSSRIHRRDSDHSGERTRARIVARGRARCDLQPAVSALSRYHGGSNSSGRAYGLFGLRRAGPMAARPGHLVRAKPHLGKHAPHQTGPLPSQRGSKRAMSERGSTPTTLAVQQFVGSVGGTALAGIEVAGYGLAARVGAAGLSSGTLTAVTEVLGNGLLHQAT